MNRPLLLVCLAVALAACAALTLRIVPGVTTEAEIVHAWGEPSRRFANVDGSTTLEYATQPAGTTCHMVTVEQDGIVREAHDALDDAHLADVQPGMNEIQVDRLLGRHRTVERFPLSGETVWDWNIDNRTGPGIATYFNVHFKEGVVVRTSRTYVFANDGIGMNGFGGFGIRGALSGIGIGAGRH